MMAQDTEKVTSGARLQLQLYLWQDTAQHRTSCLTD
jgi:hypothetical protein